MSKEPAASGWAVGFSHAQAYEWFTDCYRMRIDDDYCWGRCYLHGLYTPEGAAAWDVLTDFLVFCKMAVKRQALPPWWDWRVFLTAAKSGLPYAFEKNDAKDKYGGENIFHGAMGGRSLRYTADVIMGSFEQGVPDDPEILQVQKEVGKLDKEKGLEDSAAPLFAEVGGVGVWRQLLADLGTYDHLQAETAQG